MKTINFNGKFFRRMIGIVILLVFLIVILPAMFKVHSSNAIVNARAVYVQSPISGVVTKAFLSRGALVEKGDSIVQIDNPRVGEQLLEELKVQHQRLTDRVDGLMTQRVELENMQASFSARIQQHNKYELARIEQQIDQAKARALAQESTVKDLRLDVEKNRELLAKNFVPQIEFDRSRFALEVGEYDLQALNANVRTLQAGYEALLAGIYLGEGRNDVPYTQQKLEDIKLQLIGIEAQLHDSQAGVKALLGQIQAEQKNLKKLATATIAAPVSGFVWRQYFSLGSNVAEAARLASLVDCSELIVEADVPDEYLAELSEGSRVDYRLLGTHEWLNAEVFKIVGSGNRAQDDTLAAQLEAQEDNGRIFIKVDRNDFKDMYANQCYVGRRVEVTFDRHWNPKVLLTRLSGFF